MPGEPITVASRSLHPGPNHVTVDTRPGQQPRVAGIPAAFEETSARLRSLPGVSVLAHGDGPGNATGFRAAPLLLETTAAGLPAEVTEECFGPLTVVARYASSEDLLPALNALPASLTATVHRADDETELPAELARRLRGIAGRLVYDGYPTGVAVAWAQHHGGPWPSTNSQHSSVGLTAIRRFLRPVAWQDAPSELLPPELTDDYQDIPRRVDGVLHTPA